VVGVDVVVGVSAGIVSDPSPIMALVKGISKRGNRGRRGGSEEGI
jgi:hypothetical protein